MACASSPSAVPSNAGLSCVCMETSKVGVQAAGIKDTRRIEGVLQSPMNAHQHVAHGSKHAVRLVGAAHERRMPACKQRGSAHVSGLCGGTPPTLGAVPFNE